MNLLVCLLCGPAHWENEHISLPVLYVVRVMITQWENECISLSALSMARALTAQWEIECISLSVLSVALFVIAQWENECLSALSLARVMIVQWENECPSLAVAARNMEFSESAYTLDRDIAPLTSLLFTGAESWNKQCKQAITRPPMKQFLLLWRGPLP